MFELAGLEVFSSEAAAENFIFSIRDEGEVHLEYRIIKDPSGSGKCVVHVYEGDVLVFKV